MVTCEAVMSPEPISNKFRAFNWNVIDIDGHDFNAIIGAIDEAKKVKGKPTMIVCKTVKGKGVSFMENEAVGMELHQVRSSVKRH